ncbi:hypothetical protein GS501_04950 [Saccharibacter sp. 17.LH.SD]|uniref:hypothetical protein n=1 Tax=Saccharibacter sp. 17.LH.SD TaxID=2689393 RepID=UPI001368A720|nr:hypothetical protein [Saccharibacter sp. 17.LH.SD]MXV44395.1 hypothetical protein [Saccharibacter sp. 17.LH.SD]
MKKRLFAISTMALALVGVAWPNVGAAQSYDQIRAIQRSNELRYESELRQMGLEARLAHNAIWAMNNVPDSACATTAGILLMDYGKWSESKMNSDRIANMEAGGVCEMRVIKRPPPKEEPYDPNQDSDYQGKLFFQNHPEEAYEIFLKEGVSLTELNNIATIFTREGYQISGCTSLAGQIIYLLRRGKGGVLREGDIALYEDSLHRLKNESITRDCNPRYFP